MNTTDADQQQPQQPSLQVPSGFPELVKDLSREVLRAQPTDIHQFCADYFQKRLKAVPATNTTPNTTTAPVTTKTPVKSTATNLSKKTGMLFLSLLPSSSSISSTSSLIPSTTTTTATTTTTSIKTTTLLSSSPSSFRSLIPKQPSRNQYRSQNWTKRNHNKKTTTPKTNQKQKQKQQQQQKQKP